MSNRDLRRFRHRGNKGTSCLLLVLVVVLIVLLVVYWKLNPRIETPAPTPKPIPQSVEKDPVKLVEQKVAVTPDSTRIKAPKPETMKLARMISKGDYLLVEKSRHLLHHYVDGKLLASYSVALGKNPADKTKEGDNATPEGHYEINYIKDSSAWTHDFGDGKGAIKGAYGPYFIALYTGAKGSFSGKTWRGIGIHGTHNPASIGTNTSEGCIRMYNEELLKLKAAVEGKTSVPIDIIK